MNPLCFVLMPFGRKIDEQGRLVDFDAVYQGIIAPAVNAAAMEPIRADEEKLGGSIHKAMFERLMLCEFAVADLTGANANVYYELGIRHALRLRSTVLLFREGSRLPFDVAPLRAMPYAVDETGLPLAPEAAAHSIARRLGEARADPHDDSPLFQLVADVPRVKIAHEKTDLFRKEVETAKALHECLALAKREGREALRALAASPELRNLGDVEAEITVNLFLALRDAEDYEAMAALYLRMDEALRRTVMVSEQYALALNRLGRGYEAGAHHPRTDRPAGTEQRIVRYSRPHL
jgi:MAP3K TRAFs-binding domain